MDIAVLTATYIVVFGTPIANLGRQGQQVKGLGTPPHTLMGYKYAPSVPSLCNKVHGVICMWA